MVCGDMLRVVVITMLAIHCVVGALHERVSAGNGTENSQEIHETGRAGHRAAMLFPLLLGISARLAALVPTFLMGVVGIFVFVFFSKKALLVSLLALFLSWRDKYRYKRPKIVHIHHVSHHHPHHHEVSSIEHYPPYPSSPHSFVDHSHKKANFQKWPKIDHSSPWPMTVNSPIVDSYYPQAARRNYADKPLFFSSRNEFPLPAIWTNDSVSANSSVLSPELQKMIEKAIGDDDDDDPR